MQMTNDTPQHPSPHQKPVVVWFRDDLRLDDHPALCAAVSTGHPLICVYVVDDVGPALHAPGAALRWWLHGALASLHEAMQRCGGTLLTLHGAAERLIPALARETGAATVFWHERFHETERAQDARIASTLGQEGIGTQGVWGTSLRPPEDVLMRDGNAYRVYSPFWRAFLKLGPEEPLDNPARTADALTFHPISDTLLATDRLDAATLLPHKPDWAGGLRASWTPTEAAGQQALEHFLHRACHRYDTTRNALAEEGTSRLSPYLASGLISPRRAWSMTRRLTQDGEGQRTFLAEIGWREFARYTMFHEPRLPTTNLSTKFDTMPWRTSRSDLRAWQRGATGVPVVDAAMRQLWHTGWMHNRARMIVGSFLTKHLLIDWREGEAWFRDTLVDLDPASNAMNWQWVAGTGIDAAPFFRIFNPTRQAEKFDPEGQYIRRWVPELGRLEGKALFEPWAAKDDVLDQAGIHIGTTYPRPIIDLNRGRDRAMTAFGNL